MATKKLLSKEDKIKREINRLKKVFKNLDGNMLATVQSLIQNAAFMTVTLEDLQEAINENGCTSEYKNGENQFGTKKSPEIEIHIAMTKNHAVVIKQLADLVPPEKRKDSKLEALLKE